MPIPDHINEQLYKEMRIAIERWCADMRPLLGMSAETISIGDGIRQATAYLWEMCASDKMPYSESVSFKHWRTVCSFTNELDIRTNYGPDKLLFPRLCALYDTAHAWINRGQQWDPNKYGLYDGSKPLNLYIMREVQDNGQIAIVAAKDAAEARSVTHIDLDGDEWVVELMGVSDEFYEPRVIFSQVKE